jgi:AcrR family transcriptional regulator
MYWPVSGASPPSASGTRSTASPLLRTPGATELRFEQVAARVPVNVRTVYRYFPTQRDPLAAVGAELEKRTGWHAEKVTAENMAALTRELFVYLAKNFGEDESASPSTMDLTRQQWRGRRISAVERVIGPLTEDMDPDLARGVMAVFSGLMRLPFLAGMQQHWGLDGEQSGRAIEWAINALVEDLQHIC